MTQYATEPVLDRRFLLGEGPFYRPETDTLHWVDIKTGSLYVLELSTGRLREIQTGQYLGAAAPTRRGRFLVALTTGVYLLDDGLRPLCRPPELTAGLRLNDGKCDPTGRFLFGTIPLFPAGEEGSLFTLGSDGRCRRLLTGVQVSNGLAWTADGRTLYYIDTPTGGIDAFDYSTGDGFLGERRRVFTATEGVPDGMTIDAEGMLWVALWGTGKVLRVDPTCGAVLGEAVVSAKNPSSCCFGGKGMNILFITTSGEGLDGSGEGLVYAAKPGVAGIPEPLFDDTAL